jgi:exodeoxyribonuclease VII large subunit
MHANQRYAQLSAESALIRLRDAVSRRDQRLDELRLRLDGSSHRHFRTNALRLAFATDRLHRQNMTVRVATMHERWQNAMQRMYRTTIQIRNTRQSRLVRASSQLEALSPLAVLSRGYALIYDADGILLRSVTKIFTGQTIRARLMRGTLEAEVMQTKIDPANATEISNS